jgi:ornithine cyclodeaminase/alanine dehydrogenase-like protein (mu-crystallin family)
MIHLDGGALRSRLATSKLVERIIGAMPSAPKAPLRLRLSDPAGREFLAMPAIFGDYAGIKSLTIIPDNRDSPRPVISGHYALFSLETGQLLATMDASELTAQRTGAISAAAAKLLARPEASRLLVIGAGHLAPFMAAAHAAVRPIKTIHIWARDPVRARVAVEVAKQLIGKGADLSIEVAADLEQAVRNSDIISSATRAGSPLIEGRWLQPGTHVDLVGGYRPDMREIDDFGLQRARVFVDDRDAVLQEAGDLMDPIARGVFAPSMIAGDLPQLCAGLAGRGSDDEITLFKAVGTATADLIAAIEAWVQRDPAQ